VRQRTAVLRISDDKLAGLNSDDTTVALRGLSACARVRLVRLEVVPDNEADAAAALRSLATRCDAVLVSCSEHGCALRAAAAAFGLRLVACEQLMDVRVPEGSELAQAEAAQAAGAPPLVVLRVGSCTVFLALGAAAQLRAHVAAACALLAET
jgi:hypothetical protein